jgi:pimeloyl-ACP methyl ester carboxylesterase
MDVLRAVLGDDRLSYLGKSYGTFLGATYAQLFPHRVGRLVLDGAIDPALTYDEISIGQAQGMEQALRAYVEDCPNRKDCPLRGSTDDGLQQVRSVVDAAEQRPLRTDDPQRPLTGSLAFYGLVAPLYEDASWHLLDSALAAALAGDGSGLLELADLYADRQPDGTYSSNLLEAFNAVNCLDYPVDASPEAMATTAKRLEEASPTFGDSLAYGEVMCDEWPVPPVGRPGPVRAAGAPPILVVGTTGDPATPYPWAQALADELDAGRLLTWEGEGHTAYLRGSACVDAAVDAYLVDGVLPGEGATCRS